MTDVNVRFLFNRPREQVASMVDRGESPVEAIYGMPLFAGHGFSPAFSDKGHEPSLGRWWLKRFEDLVSDKGKKVGFNLAQAWRLRGELKDADLIFATADSSGLGVLELKSMGILKTPVVYATIGLAHSFPKGEGLIARHYAKLLNSAERIVHYGWAEGEILVERFGVQREKIRFVPFGVQTDFFDIDAQGDGPPLAFGLDKLRDWPLLFQAAKRCDFNIDLVCNHDDLVGLEIPENVRLLDRMPMKRLAQKMASSMFIILPVRPNPYTGATISLLQSLAAQKATIVSDTAALSGGFELEHEEHCIKVSPGSVDDLAAAMIRLFKNDNLRADLGRQGKSKVREKYDIRRYVLDMSNIFHEAIG